MTSSLPPIPDSPVDASGQPYVGAYAGALDTVRWGYPRGWAKGQVERALTRKRWFRVTVTDGDVLFAGGIVDQGYAGWGWVWAVDLATGQALGDAQGVGVPLTTLVVGPGAGAGADSFLKLAWARLSLSRPEDSSVFALKAAAFGLRAQLSLDTEHAATPFTVIGSTGPETPSFIQRTNLIPCTGELKAKRRKHHFGDTALGCVTYANGFFPRSADWHDALGIGRLADGRPCGFALSTTPLFGEIGQNVLWLDGAPVQLPALTSVGGSALVEDGVWSLASDDGSVDLSFRPLCARKTRVATKVVDMDVGHVAGHFSGRITVDGAVLEIADLAGIGGRHAVTW